MGTRGNRWAQARGSPTRLVKRRKKKNKMEESQKAQVGVGEKFYGGSDLGRASCHMTTGKLRGRGRAGKIWPRLG